MNQNTINASRLKQPTEYTAYVRLAERNRVLIMDGNRIVGFKPWKQ